MNGRRLIEHWPPITELGIESVRERTPMTPFPAPNRLHVWWARRPLVAARAAVLASLLPEDADRAQFLHAIGIHGGPVAAQRRIAIATRKGERLGAAASGYTRAFKHSLSTDDREWLSATIGSASILDPTAGGGSVPFESARLGFETAANDLNPVAAVIELATPDWPKRFKDEVRTSFDSLGQAFDAQVQKRLKGVFLSNGIADTRSDGYLWARTVTCPYSDGSEQPKFWRRDVE